MLKTTGRYKNLLFLFCLFYSLGSYAQFDCPTEPFTGVASQDSEGTCGYFLSFTVPFENCTSGTTTVSHRINGGTFIPGNTVTFNFPVGTNTVLLVRSCGGESFGECTVTVIVTTPPPVCNAQDVTICLDEMGNALLNAEDVDDGSTSTCSTLSYAVTPSEFDCSSLSPQSVTLTVTNTEGLSSSCNALVFIEDKIAPVCNVQNITLQVDAAGNVPSITFADIDDGSFDNCCFTSEISQTSFDCNSTGCGGTGARQMMANPIFITLRDCSNTELMDDCTAMVTVEDNVPPICMAMDITVDLSATSGTATVFGSQINNGSTDNCPNISFLINGASSLNLTCNDIGDVPVTLTVTDVCGNSSDCTAAVAVVAPVGGITCMTQDITVDLDVTGNASISAGMIDNGSFSACGEITLAVNPTMFDCTNIGENTVILTVSDLTGSANCTATVTIEDNILPDCVARPITLSVDANGNTPTITFADVDGGSSDNCCFTSEISPSSFDCSSITSCGGGDPPIPNIVTITLTECSNLEAQSTCESIVTVIDNIQPICEAMDITVTLSSTTGTVSVQATQIDDGSRDNCLRISYAINGASSLMLTCNDIGNVPVTLTVTDVCGNASDCMATVTVLGPASGVNCVTQDITVSVDQSGSATITADMIDNGSSAACGEVSLSVMPTTFDCNNIGNNTVTLTVEDDFGNSGACNAIVTIVDEIAPTCNAQDVTIDLDGNGEAVIIPIQIAGTNSSMYVTDNIFNCPDFLHFNAGDFDNDGDLDIIGNCLSNNNIDSDKTLYVNNGDGTFTQVQNVIPQTTIGSLFGHNDIKIADLNLDGLLDIFFVTISENSTYLNLGNNTFSPVVSSVNSLKAEIADINGDGVPDIIVTNGGVSTQLFIGVGDGTFVVSTGNLGNFTGAFQYFQTGDLNNTGLIDIVALDSNGDITIFENNGSENFTIHNSVIQLGTDYFELIDLNNDGILDFQLDNISVFNTGVLPVFDTSDPTFFIDNSTIVATPEANCDVGLFQGELYNMIAGSNENNVFHGDFNSDGQSDVLFQGCTSGVFNTNVFLTSLESLPPGFTDNCPNPIVELSQSLFTCADKSEINTVTITVTDASGNTSECTSMVTVEDNILPICRAKNITVELNNSSYTLSAGEIDNGSTDNCAVNLSIPPTTFNCSNLGSNTVTLTVADNCGNSATCMSEVTVQSNAMPSCITQDITISLDNDGLVSYVAADIDNGSSAECGPVTLSATPTTFDCNQTGNNTVTLTVMDDNSNSSSCLAIVTVVDEIAPICMAQDITVSLDEMGMATITSADVSDNDICDDSPIAGIVNAIDRLNPCDPNDFGVLGIRVLFGGTPPYTQINWYDPSFNLIPPSGFNLNDSTTSPNLLIPGFHYLEVIDSQGCSLIKAGIVGVQNISSNVQHPITGSDGAIFLSLDGFTNPIFSWSNGANTSSITNLTAGNYEVTVTSGNCSEILSFDLNNGMGNESFSNDFPPFPPILDFPSNEISSISDNCSIQSIDLSNDKFSCANIGPDNQVTVTVTDASGNTSSCISNVTVQDTIAPMCAIGADITVQLEPGQCDTILALTPPTVIDNCDPNPSSTIIGQFGTTTGGTMDCPIDILFVMDNSSSIDATEYNQMEASALAEKNLIAAAFPNSRFATVHYFGSCGEELHIENDFIDATNITSIVRQGSGNDDLNVALGLVMKALDGVADPDLFGGFLNKDPASKFCVVVFTDAPQGLPLGPCTVSALIPYDNRNMLAANYGANFTVVHFDPSATVDPISASIASVGGTWNGAVDNNVGDPDNGVLPRQYIPATFGTINLDLLSAIPPCSTPIDTFAIGSHSIQYEVEDQSGNTALCSYDIEILEYVPPGITCIGQINFSLDPLSCSGSLTPSMLITTEVGCIDSCAITVYDSYGNEVPNFFDETDINQTFSYQVCCGGLCCWGNVLVEYKFVPQLDCNGPVDISCSAFDQLDTPDLPTITTCLPLEYEVRLIGEVRESLDCHERYASIVTRTYGVIDADGQVVNECVQVFNVLRVDLTNITFPPSTSISCSDDRYIYYDLEGIQVPIPWVNTGSGSMCVPTNIDVGVPLQCSGGEIEFVDSGQSIGNGDSFGISLGDIDDDGDLDAAVVNNNGTNKVWINNGGVFTDSGQSLGSDGDDIELVDVDVDGDLDVYIVSAIGANRLFINNGGVFTNSGQNLGSFSIDVELGDLDGDGDLDAFVANAGSQPNKVWRNDGGIFTDSNQNIGNSNSQGVELGDIDGDSDLDAYVANGGPNKVWINNGGLFSDSNQSLGNDGSIKVSLGDTDGDGDLDAFVVNTSSNKLWINNGGIFSDSGQIIGTNDRDIELGDLDGDGDLDAFVASLSDNSIWMNHEGIFVESDQDFPFIFSPDAELGDIDGDGDLDVYVANFGFNQVLLNNTTPLTCAPFIPSTGASEVDNTCTVVPVDGNTQQLCNLIVTYTDILIPGTPCRKKIMRQWEVIEWWCSGDSIVGDIQQIELIDDEAPTIVCPLDFTVSTDDDCAGSVNIPAIQATDECGNNGVIVSVDYPLGFLNSNGGEAVLEVGNNLIRYIVADSCYNDTTCVVRVLVQDKTEPVAICEQNTVVGISQSGNSFIFADALDDGSWDECGLDRFEVARMDSSCVASDTLFSDKVAFCCTDVGQELMVIFRAIDKGDNHNDCMVRVEVQDKQVPLVTCPSNDTIDCRVPYDLDNLSLTFGGPNLDDNCPSTQNIIEDITADVNQCGIGTIFRKLNLYDADTVSILRQCVQTITVMNDTPFLLTQIQWPLDIDTVSVCMTSDLKPEDLPTLSSFPTFLGGDDQCSLLGYDYEDEIFAGSGLGACAYIERTWTVINWCEEINGVTTQMIDPTGPQIITLKKIKAPQIETVGQDTVIVETTKIDCSSDTIIVVRTAIDDCPNALDWTYTIRDIEDNVVATGISDTLVEVLNAGNYKVTWTVNDFCGNRDIHVQDLQVINTKTPTPVCINGLSGMLVAWDSTGDGMIDSNTFELWASDVDGGSYHTCDNDIALSFTPDTTVTSIMFTCDSVGIRPIRLYVTDVVTGMQDYCSTFINVQDNGNCNLLGTRVAVEGEVHTEELEKVDNVEVGLGNTGIMDMTEEDGLYAFRDMPMGGSYAVEPTKDVDYLNGVSTLDIIIIQRHILNQTPLESAYKMIAADVNNSQDVSAIDLIELRKLILGVYDELPDNDSWRFVDAEHTFVDVLNPWLIDVPENYMIGNLSSDMVIDFVGVKVGDVNGSVIANANTKSLDTRSSRWNLEFVIEEQQIEKGEIQTAYVRSSSYEYINGWQGTIEFDADKIEVLEIRSDKLIWTADNYNMASQTEGWVSMSYHDHKARTISQSDVVLEIRYRAKEDINTDGLFEMTSLVTPQEGYRNNEIVNVELRYVKSGNAKITAVFPNPWIEQATIEFYMPETAEVRWEFYDVTGRLLYTNKDMYSAGDNTMLIKRNDIKASGIVYAKMTTDTHTSEYKMMLVD